MNAFWMWLSWMLECSLKVKPTNIYLFNFFLIHFGSTWLLSCMLEGILIGVQLYHFNILIFQRLIMSHNSFLCLSPLWSNFPFCSNYFLILIFGYLFLARQIYNWQLLNDITYWWCWVHSWVGTSAGPIAATGAGLSNLS